MRKTVWKRFRHWLLETWLVYAGVVAAVYVLDALPLSLARWIGRLGGRIAYLFDLGHRAVCMENLAIAFPEKTEAERRAILKASYAHLGVCAAEFCRFKSMKPEDVRAKWVVPEDGADERTRSVLAAGKGMIGVSAHIGSWELGGFAYPALGYPLVSVSRELAAPRIDAFVTRIRARFGNEVVHQEGAVRALLRALKENKVIGIIMDQYAGREQPWIPFFTREASTVDTCAKLHIRTGAPLVSNLIIRRPDGRYTWRCRVIEIPPRGGESDEEYLKIILRACNADLEAAIRETPEQWLWMHKRWKPKPAVRGELAGPQQANLKSAKV